MGILTVFLICYGISILLVLLFSNKENLKTSPWYVVLGILLIAPLGITILACDRISELSSRIKRRKKERKRAIKREEDERLFDEWLKGQDLRRKKFEMVYDANKHEVPSSLNKDAIYLFSRYKLMGAASIISFLDKISLGNNSNFDFIENEKKARECLGTDKKTKELFDVIIVDNSIEGAWQSYLLNKIRMMYYFRDFGFRYIYSKKCLNEELESYGDILKTVQDYDITPYYVHGNNDTYYFSSCYWHCNRGLIREAYEIVIKDGKVVSCEHLMSETLYKYDCGIRFHYGY